MILAGRPAKILLIDTNVYFSKRLSDALKREGFEVNSSTQPAFALTTLEYDAPSAIVCSTNMREMGALDIARMIRADVKNAAMPIIALGEGSQRALMEAFQAGCDDYIDRTRQPAVIATHIKNIIVSKAEGFQPTQMLPPADTSLSGSLTHHDLPGVMQMLGHAHQTGALHINSGDTDALLFFDAGTITHAECGSLFGDEAVIHILKNCFKNNSGVYKFVYGSSSTQRTVLRSATDLMLDAMREVDESSRDDDAADLPALGSSDGQPTVTIAEDRLALAATDGHAATIQAGEPFLIAPVDDETALAHRIESTESPDLPATVQADFSAEHSANDEMDSRSESTNGVFAPMHDDSPITDANDTGAVPSTDHSQPTLLYDNSAPTPSFHDAVEPIDDFAAIADSLNRFAAAQSFEPSHSTPSLDDSLAPADDDSAATPEKES